MNVQTDSPLAIELFAGTMSGTAGWSELGGRAIGFDLAYEDYHGTPLGWRVIQDVLTLDGAQFKDAAFLWGSSPCQAYSYLAMPWSRSKCPLCKGTGQVWEWKLLASAGIKAAHLGRLVPCDCKENSAKAKDLRRRWDLDGPDNTLFDSVSRIQREASAAAGRFIPFIQENVRGAVPWIGKRDMSLAAWKSLTQTERVKAGRPDAAFGSFLLWGCCAQIGTRVVSGRDLADIRAGRGRFGMGVAPEKATKREGHNFHTWALTNGAVSSPSYHGGEHETLGVGMGTKGTGQYPNRGWTAGTALSLGLENYSGVKVPGQTQGKEYAMCRTGAAGQKTLGHINKRDGHGHTRHLTNQAESDAVREAKSGKAAGGWFNDYKKDGEGCVGVSRTGSKSNARKAASALIAVIPKALSDYIAAQHWPGESCQKQHEQGRIGNIATKRHG